MAKFKIILITLLAFGFISISLYGFTLMKEQAIYNDQFEVNRTLLGDNLYQSNRYTQPEVIENLIYDDEVPSGYIKIGEDENLELYYNHTEKGFIVKNTETGYIWTSFAPSTSEESLNGTMRDLLKAPVVIEYFPYQKNTESLSTTARRESLDDVNITTQTITNGIRLKFDYFKIDIEFELEVMLQEGTLVANVLQESIIEGDHKLSLLSILPNFGSTRGTDVPGYIIIPDGPGALYRFKDNSGKQTVQFSSRYYGNDMGIRYDQQANPLTNMSIPVFGMVHGINQHGFLGVIESGSSSAMFTMSPSGANAINYNLTGSQFVLRESYVFPTNLKGDGITAIQEEKHDEDMSIRYYFVSDEDANYVGLANTYQTHLVEKDVLGDFSSEQMKLRLEVLQADSKKGLFGMQTVLMSSLEDTKNMVTTLMDQDVQLDLTLRGWNKDGMSGQAPYDKKFESSVGSRRAFESFFDDMEAHQVDVHLYSDYITSYDYASRVNSRYDFARGIYRRLMTVELNSMVYNSRYHLYPSTTSELIKDDFDFINHYDIDFAMDYLGYELFSVYQNREWKSRFNSVGHYQEALSTYNEQPFYKPNAYMFDYISAYYDVPMYNSQFTFYDDTIPFLQIALRGRIDYYSPLMNFFANSDEQMLILVDYGIYPSYIVTEEPTHKLKFTQANQFFSTEFSIWENEINQSYHQISAALDLVAGENITSRTVLSTGVVQVTYSNQVRFVINYSETPFAHPSGIVEPKSFHIEVTP